MSQQQSRSPAETYEQYLGPAISDPWTRVLLEYAAPQLGERVLDVACGTGSVARHVAPMIGAQGKLVALDVNPEMVAVARALPAPPGATIEWPEGNAISLARRMTRSISCCASRDYGFFLTALRPCERCGGF
jgi:ubiquinone/menaquinone biosynthesis C-methylase UbiE